MNEDRTLKDRNEGKLKYSHRNLSHCRFVHHKSRASEQRGRRL